MPPEAHVHTGTAPGVVVVADVPTDTVLTAASAVGTGASAAATPTVAARPEAARAMPVAAGEIADGRARRSMAVRGRVTTPRWNTSSSARLHCACRVRLKTHQPNARADMRRERNTPWNRDR